jgi:hypothetical protein
LSRSAAARPSVGNATSAPTKMTVAARSIAGMRTQRSGGASIEVGLGRRVRRGKLDALTPPPYGGRA